MQINNKDYYNRDLHYAYRWCKVHGRNKQVEDILLNKKALRYLFDYALCVIKGRWEEAEEFIIRSPYFMNLYARNIIKGKLPDNLHNAMLVFGMIKTEERLVKDYLDFLKFNPHISAPVNNK
jgi:hypothetical protein